VIRLTIYSRPGCHLCEVMKAAVDRVLPVVGTAVAVEEIDISTDPELEARYGVEIPVLVLDGRKVAKYRVSDDELTRMLRGRSTCS